MSARRRPLHALLAAAGLLALACRASGPSQDIERVEFGVLFGGDVQDREEIPLELDSARQELGVRVTFRAPLSAPRLVRWELERPTALKAADGGVAYAAEIGQIQARRGERRAEAKVRLRANDLPGIWRIHVDVDGKRALDRSVRMVRRSRH